MRPPMPARLTAALCALTAAVALAIAAAPASADTDGGDFVIEYGHFKKANRKAAGILRRSGAMEAVAAEINARWALPVDIPIYFSDEIPVGPAFIPDLKLDDGTVVPDFIAFPGKFLTLELKEMRRQLKGVRGITPAEAMIAANEFVLAHEMGHALVHSLTLPVTGKEEDAVDGFAAYLLADNPKFGPFTAFSAAMFFDAIARVRGRPRPPTSPTSTRSSSSASTSSCAGSTAATSSASSPSSPRSCCRAPARCAAATSGSR